MLAYVTSTTPFSVVHQLDGNRPALAVVEKCANTFGTLPKTVLSNTDICQLLKKAPAKALRWIKSCPPAENVPHYHCPLIHWDQAKNQGLILFIPDVPIEKLDRQSLFAET